MDRFKQLDVTQSSIGAVLRADEEVVSLQDGVGLYDGQVSLKVHVTPV